MINISFTYRRIAILILAFVYLSPDTSCQLIFHRYPGYIFQTAEDSLFLHQAESADSINAEIKFSSDIDDTVKTRIDQLYDSLRTRSRKRRIAREIHDMIVIKRSSGTEKTDTGKIAVVSETPFIEYDDMIIRNIRFKQLDVFGPTVEDTTRQAKHFYEKTGNRFHINTSQSILSKNLLIKPGERLDAYILADNERVIRSLPFIHDVKILVNPVGTSSDSVDIVVVTKDLWATGFGGDISDFGKGRLAMWHRNLFGTGHEEQHTIFWDDDEKPLLGYEELYRINNMAGSFINSEFRFTTRHGRQQFLADFRKEFFTPEIKYAGALRFENRNTSGDFELIDTTLLKVPYTASIYDFWIGRSIYLKKDRLFFRERSNLMFAGRIFSAYYHDRPEVSEDRLYVFHNRHQFIGAAAISNQGYYKSRLVYRFGRTEDIPYGYLVQLIGGFEINEFKNRPYLGISASRGMYLKKRGGYLYNKFEIGGFFENREVEQGTIRWKLRYFTPLFTYNRFNVRYFINFNYTTGIKRYAEEFITIRNKEGVYGLSSSLLKGTKKMTLNFEAVSFSPYYLIGFRFVFFSFVDLGFVGPSGKKIFDNPLYSGFGLGIRLRNERLVFNTLQLRVAFYPLVPEDAEWYFIQASGEQRLKLNKFYISDPKFIEF